MKGVYVLIIAIPQEIIIDVGSMKKVVFSKGHWVYIGSAQGTTSTSLEYRLKRHFSTSKKIHWHIDYLLSDHVLLQDAVWAETDQNLECQVVQNLIQTKQFELGPLGFGASDCKSKCRAHLLKYSGTKSPIPRIEGIFKELGLTPNTYNGKFRA
ncbi:MAG: GIY-YIG nuclease family protein [Candidatus Thorarchaeota archaeon]